MAQDHAEQMRAFTLAVHHDPSALPKIHLCLSSRLHFRPHKRDQLCLPQMPYESLYGLIAAGKAVLTNQVLIDALGTQAHCHGCQDLG